MSEEKKDLTAAEALEEAEEDAQKESLGRREFFRRLLGGGALLGVAGVAGAAAIRSKGEDHVWQIDPYKCTQCGRCATDCVVYPSAVKAVHAYDLCWYCNLCGGYHQAYVQQPDTPAEHQLCPTSAINRTYIEHPFYKYDIDEEKCIGCGICVKGCAGFGNGSLYLQVRHDRCVNCNDCAIAKACPADAFVRVPADKPYILKGKQGEKKKGAEAGEKAEEESV
ncbi:ferredoxin [Verrucomicrobiota bacterium]